MANYIIPDNTKLTNLLKALRAKCIDCCCGSSNEVQLCPANTCPIWYFRLGKNPYREKRVMSEEQKEAARIRLAKGRKVKKT